MAILINVEPIQKWFADIFKTTDSIKDLLLQFSVFVVGALAAFVWYGFSCIVSISIYALALKSAFSKDEAHQSLCAKPFKGRLWFVGGLADKVLSRIL
jgi:hypothetical protein